MTPAAAIGLLELVNRPSSAELAAPPVAPSANVVVPTIHATGLMGVMRATETVLWPLPFAQPEYFGAHYEEAYTRPPKFDSRQSFMRWDGDPLWVNVAGHGLFGSEVYLRARQCHLGWARSLIFAAASSTIWEYVFEANGVRPSAQDLVYTPLSGLLLGETRYALHHVAGTLASPFARALVRGVVDPLGELERAAGTDC